MGKESRRISFGILFVLVSVLFTWQAHYWVKNWSAAQLHQNSSDRLLLLVSQLRRALNEFRYLPFLMTQNEDIKQLLISGAQADGQSASRFLEQTNLVAGSTSLFILDTKGQIRAFSHWREQHDFHTRSHANSPYFLQAQNGEEGRIVSTIEDNQAAFFISAPIYEKQRFIGAAVVRVDLALLQDKLPIDTTWLIALARQNVILASEPSWIGLDLNDLNQHQKTIELADETELHFWPKLMRHTPLVQSVHLDDLNWQVSVVSKTKQIEQYARLSSFITFSLILEGGLFALYVRERRLKKHSQQETRDILAQSEAEKINIIDNAQVGLLTLNHHREITFANATALRQFQQTLPELLESPLLKCIEDNHAGPIRTTLDQSNTLEFKPLIAHEAKAIRNDNSVFPILISITKMVSNDLFLVTIIDISRRKQLEHALQDANVNLEFKVEERTKALKEAQEELLQAEKMAALGRMSTAVVHELNQPLTAMRTYIAICQHLLQNLKAASPPHSDNQQNSELITNLTTLNDLTDRMSTITRQLKTFAYKKPEQSGVVDITQCLDLSLNLFKDRITHQGVSLDIQKPEQPVYIQGDSARLEQVFTNLIHNALDAMESNAAMSPLQLSINIKSHDQSATVDITDNGPGIDPEQLPRIFEPFFTTKSMGAGLGLGLAIVKSIVNDLNGSITVKPLEGGGTGFSLVFPQSTQQ